MARIVERPRARQELEDIAVPIGAHRPSAARRCLQAAQKAYGTLSAMPELGALWEPEAPRFAGVRHFPIPRFPGGVPAPLPSAVFPGVFEGSGLQIPRGNGLWQRSRDTTDFSLADLLHALLALSLLGPQMQQDSLARCLAMPHGRPAVR